MISAPPDTAPPDTDATTEAESATSNATAADPLDSVMPLGQHTVYAAPGITVSLRRWRYRGQARVDLVIIGIPTDQTGAPLRDQLLRLRAHVLAGFLARGMYIFSTERNHDAAGPRMTLIDRLK